jgi:hypothetical protein
MADHPAITLKFDQLTISISRAAFWRRLDALVRWRGNLLVMINMNIVWKRFTFAFLYSLLQT